MELSPPRTAGQQIQFKLLAQFLFQVWTFTLTGPGYSTAFSNLSAQFPIDRP